MREREKKERKKETERDRGRSWLVVASIGIIYLTIHTLQRNSWAKHIVDLREDIEELCKLRLANRVLTEPIATTTYMHATAE